MVIGISIDDVFRNFSDNFIITLDKIYGGITRMENVGDDYFSESGNELVTRFETDYGFKERFEYDLLKLSSKYGIKTKKQLNNILYNEYSFEFFATCELIDKSYKLPNKFNKMIIDLEEDYEKPIDIIIIDRGISRSVTSTLFFMSKCGIYPYNIKFVKNYGDEWEHVDCLITANNETLSKKPEKKTSMKISTEYNKNIDSDYSYNNLEQAIDDIHIIIKKIIENEN